ncbi:hemolysin N-terminal domain-containing protein [Photobacterium leiognathi]|uniref:hemolysin N-terminal domain-containing protein n=1 Tax=Photobacterium leiognathi TaxID=553611 RepID=UPI0027362CA3|nr:hemolysin N-terminal domain-containing protein [Photobacterium leiognathi]
MLTSRRWSLCVFCAIVGLFSATANANDDLPQGIAVQILSQLQDSGQVNYVNAENWLIDKKQSVNQNATSSLTLIKKKY